jgi:rhodanese-related sulfurtransferase
VFRSGIVVVLILAGSAGNPLGAQPGGRIDQATLMEPNQRTPEVSTEELKRVLADGSALVLDARPYLEYAMSHVPGALNVSAKPGVPISVYVSDVREIERLVGGDRAKPLVLYCNGPFCGKSKRLSEELVTAGFTNVRRYQLGIPVWRALVRLTEIELEGVLHVLRNDRTAVFLDARSGDAFLAGSIPGAKSIPVGAVQPGKERRGPQGEGRWAAADGGPQHHNTRIVVFGRDAAEARTLAEAVAREAFHNVAYFPGTFDTLRTAIK